MNAVAERISEVLSARGWKFELDEKTQMTNMVWTCGTGQWPVRFGDLKDAVLILSRFPIRCPEEKRNACAELLARINFGVPAIFEMDFGDGEILCRTLVPYDKELPTTELLDHLIGTNLFVMGRYLPVIMAVIHTQISPAQAVMDLVKALELERDAKSAPAKPEPSVQPRFQFN